MLSINAIHKTYADHPVLRDVSLVVSPGGRLGLIGPNGCGKTTLLRLIAGLETPDRGSVHLPPGLRLGYLAQGFSAPEGATLADCLRLAQGDLPAAEAEVERQALRLAGQPETPEVHAAYDAALRSFLYYFLFAGDDVFTPVAELSHGERARLALAMLVAQGCNFLLLDEPINHLDIPARMRFEQALEAFPGAALVIAHDRYFIARYATRLWRVEAGGLREYLDPEAVLGLSPAGEPAGTNG